MIILPCIKCNISLVLISPGSVETDVGWGGNLKSHLMASCIRNICAKNRQNPLILLKVTIDNVGVPFYWDTVYMLCGIHAVLWWMCRWHSSSVLTMSAVRETSWQTAEWTGINLANCLSSGAAAAIAAYMILTVSYVILCILYDIFVIKQLT